MSSGSSSQRSFDARMEAIRSRFERERPARLARASGLVPLTRAEGREGAEAVAGVYDAVHAVCGLAGTVGHPEIGNAARQGDRCLGRAFRAGHGLDDAGFAALERAFAGLRAVTVARFGG